MIYFQSLTKAELAELILPFARVRGREIGEEERERKAKKQAAYRAQQLFHWVYQRFVTDYDEMTDISKELRGWLKENVEVFRLTERVSNQALDGTHKFLWTLHDQKTIESVIIPAALQEKSGVEAIDRLSEKEDAEDLAATPALSPSATGWSNVRVGAKGALNPKRPESEAAQMAKGVRFSGRQSDATVDSGQWRRLTACISSQVGCAMACKFCLTGVQGLDRHLQTHEIVTQVHELRRRAPITNIVFMGMGEPLHNLDNVAKACQILLDQDGLGFSKRKVTVSTSGLVPAIEELGKRVDVSLAISLNASNDEQRSAIMPVNKRWNIAALMEACRNFPLGPHRRITFEYVMLRDFNDTLEDAARVVKLTRGIPSKLNLIPFNEHSGAEFKRPDDVKVKAFQRYLLDRGVTATVRISRGRDILAACGQLRSIFGTARGTDKHKDWVRPEEPSATG
ncbi:MAG: 23S rRNA (adenine(2503)-C(2))-methyltransferase RlmN [Bdellovibrionales bacterium]|nr:23S rRNA (adenine(2503)-C(2))-methyltransferase RlmN [Bdellovibrionales bacterium]